MTDWREARTFCNGCGTWRTKIWHQDCPLGSKGSLLWIDIENLQEACNKCNQAWALETSILYCTCGHVQSTEYVDSIDVAQASEQVIATDGNLVYVLTQSGTVVVGQRSFPGMSYLSLLPRDELLM
jgi:hypothetical protein